MGYVVQVVIFVRLDLQLIQERMIVNIIGIVREKIDEIMQNDVKSVNCDEMKMAIVLMIIRLIDTKFVGRLLILRVLMVVMRLNIQVYLK